ncbi:GTP 3',8-cyclase MoaA [Acetobacter conturbans]|uniref:GTP 3',8-cyclase n=1 Tax=Acetobacter conturbans TaxID=1737472 RepID=A0ABX0K0B1_9PROT|nr:GTP 3',8-cyclase MoaA [Acetobacter conturbans]NHN87472.1 GTP 3',8-cyclase MoaA [Acetobacter conturbans]
MQSSLIDSKGRHISYLRVSVTDRCDMRCVYCMAEDMEFLPRPDVLDFEELEHLCSIFIKRGVRRIRLTGGEPLVRRDVDQFITALGRRVDPGSDGPALDELTLTTNGSQLDRHVTMLVNAGIRRINVSLDSLKPERFLTITRRGHFERVLSGILAARKAGLGVRINTVVMKGVNDDEIDDLVRWCGEIGADLCLIETMPMGETGEDRRAQYLSLHEVRQRLAENWTFESDATHGVGGPARYVRIRETGQRIGFITPLSHNFCDSCNRVRLSCDGKLYTCLSSRGAVDLRSVLRGGGSDSDILAAVEEGLAHKPFRHDFLIPDDGGAVQGPRRLMSVTGG